MKQFWKEAMRLAAASPTDPVLPSSCPKVFVYTNLSNATDDDYDEASGLCSEHAARRAFGDPLRWIGGNVSKHFRSTGQWNLGRIIRYRLLCSSRCRARSPEHADLFFAPVLTKPKNYKEYTSACRATPAAAVWRELYSHESACRHFFVVSKGHYVARDCVGWWTNPEPRFRPFARLAYTPTLLWPENASEAGYGGTAGASELARLDSSSNNALLFVNASQAAARYPQLISVPYPSSFHWSRAPELSRPPWAVAAGRSTLMLFVGYATHGDIAVRRKIAHDCEGYRNRSVCVMAQPSMDAIALKARAVFCLEPVGDSPFRKSTTDSIVLGCIPVLFSSLTDEMAPWSWGALKARGRVLVPRDAYLAGALDLSALLQSVPPRFLSTMQRTLAAIAKGFQISLDDDPGDGLELLLHGLLRQSRQRCPLRSGVITQVPARALHQTGWANGTYERR